MDFSPFSVAIQHDDIATYGAPIYEVRKRVRPEVGTEAVRIVGRSEAKEEGKMQKAESRKQGEGDQ